MTDIMKDIFRSSLDKVIDEWRSDGLEDTQIEERIQMILKGDAVLKAFESCSKIVAQRLQETMYQCVLEERAFNAEFVAQHEQIWGNAFVTSEAMYIMAVESGKQCNNYELDHWDDVLADKHNKLYALKALHIRACQQYAEIICLMKGGFADGALARWRSLYELCVVAKFVADNDEKVAEAYISKDNWDNGYHDWAKASPAFASKKGHVHFSDLQNVCNFSTDAYKRLYQFSCKYVHAAPMGTFTRIGHKQRDSVLAGRSDYGMTAPAEHAALALAVICKVYFGQLPFFDGIAYADTMLEWAVVITSAYAEAENKAFSDQSE
ncbi:MAG: hypothetical protein J6A48_07875 [Clostridia bacterium]|nr:hypothetical protein [Clostridia bacterium]